MLECKKTYLLACYVFFFRQIISIYFESNLGYLAIVLVGKGRLSPICLLWLWAAQRDQFSFISRNCSQMKTNFHTYSIWYAHAWKCHNVITIRISQAREHNQSTITFNFFYFKLSPESKSLSKYQTALMISRHSLSWRDKICYICQ